MRTPGKKKLTNPAPIKLFCQRTDEPQEKLIHFEVQGEKNCYEPDDAQERFRSNAFQHSIVWVYAYATVR